MLRSPGDNKPHYNYSPPASSPRPFASEKTSIVQDFAKLVEGGSPEVKRARADLSFYAEWCFRDARGLPLKNAPFHNSIYSLLLSERRLLLMLPRGSGKSTICCTIYPTWVLGRERDTRILFISNSDSQAQRWLVACETIFSKNLRYRELFGNLIPPPRTLTWNEQRKSVLGRSPYATNFSLCASGYGGGIIGERADIIIVDDIVDKDNAVTPYQRRKLIDWFWEVVPPVLDPRGQMIIVGTPWAADDLYSDTAKKYGEPDILTAITPESDPLSSLAYLTDAELSTSIDELLRSG